MQEAMLSLTNKIVFHWKKFPISPPRLISEIRFSGNGEVIIKLISNVKKACFFSHSANQFAPS